VIELGNSKNATQIQRQSIDVVSGIVDFRMRFIDSGSDYGGSLALVE
jgi:hypothetical protein